MNKKRVFVTVLLTFVLSFICAFAAACSKPATHTHTAESKWQSDSSKHWHNCTANDGAILDEGAHVYDNDQDANCNICGYKRQVTPPTPSNIAVTGVTLSSSTLSLKMGETESATLTATVTPVDATNKAVSWSSDNEAVATVANGVVTAVSAGTATITVTTADGNKTASCAVTVQAATPPTPTDIAVTGVELNAATASLKMGETESVTLTATVTPADATNKAVSWSSDNEAVATVANGVVTAVSAGTATITVTTVDGNKTATCVVTVAAADPVTPPVDPSYTANGTYTLDIANAGATAGIYTWTQGTSDGAFGTATDSTKYFKISSKSGAYDYLYVNLKLSARKIITINCTARTSNLTDSTKNSTVGISLQSGSTGAVEGLAASFTVSQAEGNKAISLTGNVTAEGTIVLQLSRTAGNTGCELLDFAVNISDPAPVSVESVSLNKTASALKVGETETLVATVSPAAADNTSVTWSTSDATIATVENGVVTALKAGTVTITATSAGDSTKTASCTYTITNVAPTSLTLNRTEATIEIGDTVNLVATVLPENATIKTVTWTSSNAAIATVSESGVVTAVAVGNVTITATSTEDSSVKATCAIEIKTEIITATAIALNHTSEELKVGDTLSLTATITPANTDDKSVTWTTSNAAVATVDANGLVTVVGAGSATITATSNSNSALSAECAVTATYQTYSVTFKDGTTTKDTQIVNRGETATRLNLTKQGYALEGWYTDSGLTTKFDFTTPITADITLYVKWVAANIDITYSMGNFESAAVEWDETNASAAKVEYKLSSAADSAYVQADSELIRQIDRDTARVDVLGLKGNESYDIKVTSSSKGEAVVTLDIKAYDRSGYAHYNRAREGFGVDTGVGAYNDDGTLKDNAIVIYVTNENKDTVMKDVVAKYSGVAGYEQLQMFQIPYNSASGISSKWHGKDADGIGWWLNNNQYTTTNAASSKNKVPSNTCDPNGQGATMGFRGITNNPIVIRLIGTIEVPEGLTAYNCEQEGGSVGDNGNMARMKNCQNITIEGVGTDAQIHGWGIHFMGGTDAVGIQGMSFEVRNITFSEYTEDALGMEGVQDGSTITGPVERVWVHHNTFLPGHCANPAESDKAEGDGSCDFKRGQYYTCSYNWFEYCHKTNLIGSSDSSLQFNVSFHHNTWWQCGSRIPLGRQANMHFYNNYIYADAAETTTPYSWISKPALSYVHSLRANCYIFSEANYYDGCKNVTDGKSGGTAKGWNNIYFACMGTNTVTDVSSREQAISSNCSYGSYDYSTFDTDPTLFYYDSANKVSDCYLTDAVTAREECLRYSGVLKQDYSAVDTRMVKQTPSKALTVPSTGLTIDLTKAAVGKEVEGVLFVNAKNSSGAAKGKDVLAVFTLAENTEVSISGSAIEIAGVDGTHLGTGGFNGSLDAGTYFVRSAEKAKEGSISSMSFKCGVTNEQRVANTIALINAIGTVTYTADCKAKIDAAQSAYSALDASSKAQVTNASTLTSAITQYNTLAAAPVITLINEIGTVDANSGSKITAARNAYGALTADQKALVTNYSTLVAAEEAYVAYEVEGINNAIAALADPATATTEAAIAELLAEYYTVVDMYEGLSDEQKTQVTNYTKVTTGIATLTAANAPYEVKAMIADLPAAAEVTRADATAITAARTAYDALTTEQKAMVDNYATLTAAEAALADLSAGTEYVIFAQNAVSSGASVTGNYKTGLTAYTVDGQSYTTAVKMESSTSVTFTTASTATVTLVFHSTTSGAKVKIDGTSYTIAADKTVTVELAAGTHTITKDSTNVFLCYAIVEA